MARNIEIKARVEDLAALAATAAALASEGPIEIAQDDIFFRCDWGRLKLRVLSPTRGELIFYQRDNARGPKESFYMRAPTADPDALREVLTLAFGQVGRVAKRRTLYRIGRIRIHLDKVENLGEFLELEVVLNEGESPEAGVRQARELMARLGIEPSTLVDMAYVDLLANPTATPGPV